MRVPSLLSCILVYIASAASLSYAHDYARRDAFSSLNGMKMVPKPAAGSPSDGSIKGLMNRGDIEYIVNITLGGSVFAMQVDTGSADLVLYPDQPIKTTSVVKGSNVSQVYGAGSFAGSIAFAELKIGGHTIDSQVFLNATSVDEFITTAYLAEGLRGILGLDAGIDNTNLQDDLYQKYGNKGLVMGRNFLQNIFADSPDLGNFTVVALGRSDDGESAGEGYLAIGEYPEQLKDSFAKADYVDVVEETGLFTVYVDAVKINGKGLPLNSSVRSAPHGKAVATLDTGATAAQVTQDIFDAIYQSIPGAFYRADVGYYVVPCLPPDAPNITITIGGVDVYINPLDLTTFKDLRPDYNYSFCQSAFTVFDLGPGFAGRDFLLGDSFLRNVYTSFYYGALNASYGWVKSPAVKLVPETGTHDVHTTYSDFLNVRRQKLASSPPEATRAQIEKIISEMLNSDNTTSGAVEDVASGASTDSNASSYQSLLDKLDTFAPIVFGLLGAIVVVLFGLLGVGITLCIRRGRTVGGVRAASALYAPVPAPTRFKEPVPEYRDEENARYDQ
ncbi:unnamed protein product [Peniophora sp. CBMAI 1063]|nr:unnamed protein product [Peniophora sp. CBMAI 1063]